MDETMALRQSLLQEVAKLMDDNEALREACEFLKGLVAERLPQADEWADEETEELTAEEKAEVLDDIREGLREVKAARECGYELKSVDEFLYEIRHQAG